MSASFDPWAVLGLAPGASVAEARAARRRLAKQLHPDLSPPSSDSAPGARMALVNQALAEVEIRAGHPSLPVAQSVDDDTFSVAALPAEAFEALFVVAYGLGEVLVADEPYALEVFLLEPLACFCSLSLVPEAGGSIVTIDLSGAEGTEPPPRRVVRDALVAELATVAAGADRGCQETHRPVQG